MLMLCFCLSIGSAGFAVYRKVQAGWKEAVAPAAFSALFNMGRIVFAPQVTTPVLLICLAVFLTGCTVIFRFDEQRSWPEAAVAAALVNSILLEIFYGATGA